MSKIALISDIHGNLTALEAVLADAKAEQATHYFILGDLIIPGPGCRSILNLLKALPNIIIVRGNWDDFLFWVKSATLEIPTNVYGCRLAKYVEERLRAAELKFVQELPLLQVAEINGLKFLICHHLPHKNHGGDLWPIEVQENFDGLFLDYEVDVAIYGHMHLQLLRYSTAGQMILNPGSVGMPVFTWEAHARDLRAQYGIIDVDDVGIQSINFKKVTYDVEKEVEYARKNELPYVDLYANTLKTGIAPTHNKELLAKVNAKFGYKEEVIAFLAQS